MSVATLLNPQDPWFAFDHDQMHRRMIGAQGSPGVFKTTILDPLSDPNVPAGFWNGDHSVAHANFASAFSAVYWPSTVHIVDISLTQETSPWWELSNKSLHDLANSVLPISAA